MGLGRFSYIFQATQELRKPLAVTPEESTHYPLVNVRSNLDSYSSPCRWKVQRPSLNPRPFCLTSGETNQLLPDWNHTVIPIDY